ncbi:hypothetical protein CHS0354_027244, partial [Potamilus streckersoni]
MTHTEIEVALSHSQYRNKGSQTNMLGKFEIISSSTHGCTPLTAKQQNHVNGQGGRAITLTLSVSEVAMTAKGGGIFHFGLNNESANSGMTIRDCRF